MVMIMILVAIATLPIGSSFSPVAIGTQYAITSAIHHEVETFHETYEVAHGAQLTVENANGGIAIHGWDEDIVDVQAEKKTTHGAEELQKVDIEVNTDEGIAIRTTYLEKNASVSVHYTIRVPDHVLVTMVETSNGSIELTDVHGDVVATTSNGDIIARELDGRIEVQTSNGSIELTGINHLEQARTSNGRISAEILSSPTQDTDFLTSNGSIDLYIAGDVDADVMLSTTLGKVSVRDVDMMVEEKSLTFFRGVLGRGGDVIRARTTNGSVTLHKLQ